MEAGKLDKRFGFYRRQDVEDGAGNTVADWVHQFTQAGDLMTLKGGEGVMSSRLQAQGPAILTIRASVQARAIDADWQAVDVRTQRIYAIKEQPRISDDRAGFEMLVVAGVAA